MYWSHTWCRNIGERKRLLCISKYHRRKVSFCNKSIESPITKDNLHSVCACQLTNRFNIVTSCGQYYGITLPNRFNIVTSCGQYYGITLPLPPPPPPPHPRLMSAFLQLLCKCNLPQAYSIKPCPWAYYQVTSFGKIHGRQTHSLFDEPGVLIFAYSLGEESV